jgi:2-polyprenyl-6-hydroxyphenyl methylase/3-demethylubiquinone-9 3-methyltransferase
MKVLSTTINEDLLSIKERVYLSQFPEKTDLKIQHLFDELDLAWNGAFQGPNDDLYVDALTKFYSHPVWILNGIFSSVDPVSLGHRIAIAEQICKLNPCSVVDYGGGLGELSIQIAKLNSSIAINIVEPYPTNLMKSRILNFGNIAHLTKLPDAYDLIVAQDVLEHVKNPIELSLSLISNLNKGGYIIFANCFFPLIKCHLSETFYLRYTFSFIMKFAGLKKICHINNASHAIIFRKDGLPRHNLLAVVNAIAKFIGPTINLLRRVI